MRVFCLLLITVVGCYASGIKVNAKDDKTTGAECMKRIHDHLERELKASLTYLSMGSWANEYTVNRPGLAKAMFHMADEERGHALTLLRYLRMRGFNDNQWLPSMLKPLNGKSSWSTSTDVLKEALAMEKQVTLHIKEIVDVCNDEQDHQAADYLTSEFLKEQMEGQRYLAGLVNTLTSLKQQSPQLADWLFDRKVLSE